MSRRSRLGLFEGYGVELEYMIVDARSLDVRPMADALLFAAAGRPAAALELGDVGWSNELALHVIELKTNGPALSLGGLAARFQDHVRVANLLLESEGCALLPTAMHPWMDPATETHLWPHEQNAIYHAYDRIFGTRGHGWSNLQSTHLNLPFGSEEEFVRLHAAIRVALPLIPALAASSPIFDGGSCGLLDGRLDAYRRNQVRVPSLTAMVVPEAVRSEEEYRDRILGRIYRDIAPLDPAGELQHEWLNSRGAIARFERSAIEIRVIDIQECPRADLAVAAAIVAVVRALAEERWAPIEALHRLSTDSLAWLLRQTTARGGAPPLEVEGLAEVLGLCGQADLSVREVWSRLLPELVPAIEARQQGWDEVYRTLLREGTLAERILRAVGPDVTRTDLHRTYGRLRRCLARGQLFSAPSHA